jgi:hypothetical protein
MLSFIYQEKHWYPMEGGWEDSRSSLDPPTRRKILPDFITLIKPGENFKSKCIKM